ncbi:Molybdenum transport ATP-binding protein ModC (TC 3.A.1.8.1) [hydrothermal vent metagenome]|uniref:Molybdenum transport ATP-binding protein ModC (TC 3.A.1.8.1) n=1 Tax=hydrothermal vent metagenome TaxID=652676 RepID=A0A1W1CLG0_9ZZZZ
MISIDIHKRLHGSQGQMSLDIKLDIEQGEFVVLMGESGSGKTTLLRILAGLEKAEGCIVVEGDSWEQVVPQKRQIGFVFQDYALFENMSVEENLLFVKRDKALAQKLLALTELTGLASFNVKNLSGGQKQRVSLCRAMMNKPKLLLMDEPLSALDMKMRELLQEEIAKLHKAFGTTTIMVSHDAVSSYALADRIIVLKQGKIMKDGMKDEVLQKSTQISYALVD